MLQYFFVDHHLRLKYVHLQDTILSEDTLRSKVLAFEVYAPTLSSNIDICPTFK